MFCKNCGKEIFDEAVFCPHCGTTVKNEISQNTTIQQIAEKKNLGFAFIIIGIITGAISAIFTLFTNYVDENIPRFVRNDSYGLPHLTYYWEADEKMNVFLDSSIPIHEILIAVGVILLILGVVFLLVGKPKVKTKSFNIVTIISSSVLVLINIALAAPVIVYYLGNL